MVAGVIPYSSIPANLPPEIYERVATAGFGIARAPDGVHVSDIAGVTAFVTAYVGSASELAYHKIRAQQSLDDFFDAHFDLAAFIRGGTTTGITGAQVGNFLASIANNYRTLKIQIAGASTLAAINAIVVTAGWPSNP